MRKSNNVFAARMIARGRRRRKPTPSCGTDFLDMQGRWLRLASSYELGERLTTSTNSIKPSAR
jgi:hypothetical protein